MSKKVFVGLSGGVDSAVSAYLLKEQGYDVVGVYMKNWSRSIGRFECPWQEDYQDAKRTAIKLDIPFEMFDFETEYFDSVVHYMLDSFRQGITPNPDVMCNQEIKFKVFLEASIEHGADYIATGHYARSEDGHLLKAKDENKDQTYFLYRIKNEAVKKTIFPLATYLKSDVRKTAESMLLPPAHKKESMGICFVGKVGIKDFLKEFIGPQEKGPLVNQHGAVIGEHDGAIFYTIGQRSGLGVGGGLPYYVYNKDMVTNTVYVTSDISDENLWADKVHLVNVHWINKPENYNNLYIRNRHRAELVSISHIEELSDDSMVVSLNQKVRAVTPGQSSVIYGENECFGGGIVTGINLKV